MQGANARSISAISFAYLSSGTRFVDIRRLSVGMQGANARSISAISFAYLSSGTRFVDVCRLSVCLSVYRHAGRECAIDKRDFPSSVWKKL